MTRDPAAWVATLSDSELRRVTRTYRKLYESPVLEAADREAEARGLALGPLDAADAFEDEPIELRASLQIAAFATMAGLVAGQFAYSMRPDFPPLVRQLPWRTVLMRAGDLHDPSPLIVLLAKVSFVYLVLGTAVGALLGALVACMLLLRRRRAVAAAAGTSADAAAAAGGTAGAGVAAAAGSASAAAGAATPPHREALADPLAERLVRLAELRGRALITEAEYGRRKAELLQQL